MKRITFNLEKGKLIIHKKLNNEITSVMFEDVPQSCDIKKKISENLKLLLCRENPIILTDTELKNKLKEIAEKQIINKEEIEEIEELEIIKEK